VKRAADYEGPQCDETPEELNVLEQGEEGRIVHWWFQAMKLIQNPEGYQDFLNDAAQYTEKTIECLTQGLPIWGFLYMTGEAIYGIEERPTELTIVYSALVQERLKRSGLNKNSVAQTP